MLLPSQIATMKDEFDALDRYNDQTLKRMDFIRHLRTTELIVDFIDQDAVQVADQKKTVLTLDQVLLEIERDETYEIMNMPRSEDTINHKEFITWNEFLSYFEDYRVIEERNRKAKSYAQTRDAMKPKADTEEVVDQEEELKNLLEQEKERRLLELPKLRPQDMIDITEEQLALIKGIYESLPKVTGGKQVETI